MIKASWMIVLLAATVSVAQADEPKQNEGCPVVLKCQKQGDLGLPYSVKLVKTSACSEDTVVVTIGNTQCTSDGKVKMTFNQK